MGNDISKNAIPRQSNIELLRIISMIIIIAHRVAVHSGFDFTTDFVMVNELWVLFLKLGGKIGVVDISDFIYGILNYQLLVTNL